MKKNALLILAFLFIGVFNASPQDTIAGWTMPTGETDDKYCNVGTEENIGAYDLRATNKDDVLRDISYTYNEEEANYFAKASRWDEGKDYKFWMVRFKAQSYKDIKIYSRQRSDGVSPGPRDFAIEFKLGSTGSWTRLDSVVVENNWTSGVVESLEMPAISDNYPNIISLRWIMISDSSAYADEVLEDGISWIDDILITGTYVEPNQQPIIAGWTFPNALSSDYSPDTSTAENADFQLELINANTGDGESFNLVSGYSTYAASASQWKDMANEKYWLVKFKTADYKDINFSSRQSSRKQNPGPSSFKVQFRLGGSDWADVDSAEVQVDDTWNSGVLTNIPLPEICWDTTASVYLRWLSTSNVDFNGDALAESDISVIDDLIIRGSEKTIGTREIEAPEFITVSPVPASSRLTVKSDKFISEIAIINLRGRMIWRKEFEARDMALNLTGLEHGIYLVKVTMQNGYVLTKKVPVY